MDYTSLLPQVAPANVPQAFQQQAELQQRQLANQQLAAQNAVQPQVLQQQLAQGGVNLQEAQDKLNSGRRANAIKLYASIADADPDEQQQLYQTLAPVIQRMAPDMQFADQYDPTAAKTLTSSLIDPTERMKQIEQQKVDQGKYQPLKDVYGNTTGMFDQKTGQVIDNPLAVPPAPAVSPDGTPVTGDAYLQALPAAQRGVVKAIGEGRMAPISGYALSHGPGAKIMADVQAAYPDYNANAFGALKEFSTGKLGSTVRSLNVANDHLDTLGQYATALQNGDSKALNALGNAIQTQIGKPAPQNFEAAKQIVADEVVKAVIGAGGGQGDRENAQKVISAANRPEQLAGVIQTYKTLMKGQLSGLQQQYETATGRKDFLDRLSAKTKQEIVGETQTAPPSVTTQAEFDALQPGTLYVEPDGKTYRKP